MSILNKLTNQRVGVTKNNLWTKKELPPVPTIQLEGNVIQITLTEALPHTKGFVEGVKLANFRRRDSYLILPQASTRLTKYYTLYRKVADQ